MLLEKSKRSVGATARVQVTHLAGATPCSLWLRSLGDCLQSSLPKLRVRLLDDAQSNMQATVVGRTASNVS